MEKKESYTLEEIIIGLHKEYLVHQQAINELKKMCTADPKKVENFYFGVCKEDIKNNPILMCFYNPKLNAFQKKVVEYQKRTGYYVYGRHMSRMVTDNNKYFFLRDYKFPIYISDIYTGAFYSQATSILNSEFSQNISSRIINNMSGIDGTLELDPRFINFFIRRNYILPRSSFIFTPDTDSIKIVSYDGDINSAEIREAFQVKFSSEELSQYHLQLLENSQNIERPLILEEQFKTENIELFIQEEEKGFVLSKTKKPKKIC